MSLGNKHDKPSSNPGSACVSLNANALEQNLKPSLLSPAMCRIIGRTLFSNLSWTTDLGEGKTEFKT